MNETCCPQCKEKLQRVDWNLSCYLYRCENVYCNRFHQPAGVEKKNPFLVEDELLPEVKTKASAKPSRRRGGKRKYGNWQRSYFAIVEGGPLMVTKWPRKGPAEKFKRLNKAYELIMKSRR